MSWLKADARTGAAPGEHPAILVLKALVLMAAVGMLVGPLSTGAGLAAALVATPAGVILALWMHRMQVRLPVGLGAAVLLVAFAWAGSSALLGIFIVPSVEWSVVLAGMFLFGFATLGAVCGLRFLSARVRTASILEAAAVVAVVVLTFHSHRHGQIHRPRFLSDWALLQGFDLHLLLVGFGFATALLAILLLLSIRRVAKALLSLLFLAVIAVLLFLLADRVGGNAMVAWNTDSTSTIANEDRTPNFSAGGDGNFDPVALAVFHDEYLPPLAYYFRQGVWSRYDGRMLVRADEQDLDDDVLSLLPEGVEELEARRSASTEDHRPVSTSVFLLTNLQEVPSLTASVRLAHIANPNPRYFADAFGVESATLVPDLEDLRGRTCEAGSMSPRAKEHYLAVPPDPRYLSLTDDLLRAVPPDESGDPIEGVLAVKRYLEREMVYSLKVSKEQEQAADPVAFFLFESKQGFCVHLAHAAAYLLRALGIPSRVAYGYAAQHRNVTNGEMVVLIRNPGHAWPEFFVDDVGWVAFDIQPERSLARLVPPRPIDLERILSEVARGDRTGGLAPDPRTRPWRIPWAGLVIGVALALALAVAGAYSIKAVRHLLGRRSGADIGSAYRATLDRLTETGLGRRVGETRERHAIRLAPTCPGFQPLTRAFLRHRLGPPRSVAAEDVLRMARQVSVECAAALPLWKRLAGWLNPVGWWFTR